MRYFLPDSQDLVDPSFNFETERRSINRVRQRDDQYAHEVFSAPAFDGLLVSKGIVDGFGAASGRYTAGQRHRLLRLGAAEFFRVSRRRPALPIMGDCGAFTYVREKAPPYTVEELVEFYDACQFDYGLSLDHVILQFRPDWDAPKARPDADVRQRQQLTLKLARDFLRAHKAQRSRFVPYGVAQGWSPKSYARSVASLQKMGFAQIALGGMVPLRTAEILSCLEEIGEVRKPSTKLHLLGVTRTDHVTQFARYGVESFDSTSPLRQAFKDDRDNFYTLDRTYTAIRIPQVEGNTALQRLIQSGKVKQETARRLEQRALATMHAFDAGKASVANAVRELRAYEQFYDAGSDHAEAYRETLEAAPWKQCRCEVCSSLGHHVILFRGAERNRRRGFHNVWTFYRRLRRELGDDLVEAA